MGTGASGTVPVLEHCWAVPAGLEPFSAAGTIQARATALTGGVLQRAHVALFLLDARWGTAEKGPTAQHRHPQPKQGCFIFVVQAVHCSLAAAAGLHASLRPLTLLFARSPWRATCGCPMRFHWLRIALLQAGCDGAG